MPQDFGVGTAEPHPPRTPREPGAKLGPAQRLLLGFVFVTGAGFLLGYVVTVLFVFPSQDPAGTLTRVPRIVGLQAEEARNVLGDAGLAYDEEPGLHHDAAVGTVVAQEPLGGQMARPGAAVQVTLSIGPKTAPVPDVVGLSHEQAEVALARAGYESDLVWVDAEADVGQVVDTRPAPGTPLQLPGRVRLVVSAGPEEVEVPSLVTRSLTEARVALERIGLRLGTVREDSASLAAPGTVLRQSPSPGTVVQRATRVALIVAIAPEPEDTTNVVPADTAARNR